MVLNITNLHILRYLPTYWLYLLECYTIDNQRCAHTASKTCYNRDYYKRHKQKIYHRQAQRNIAPKETRVQPSIQLR